VLELMVLEGADAGQQFTVDGGEVRIGRGRPVTGHPGAVLLGDPSISSLQATIHSEHGRSVLEHHAAATNPTLVNGRRIKKEEIGPGDVIQMGLVKIEVRARAGIALTGLFDLGNAPTERGGVPGSDATTLLDARGMLVLVRGIPELEGESYPLRAGSTLVGRSASCHVSVPEAGISRVHLRCEWQGDELVLFPLSETNSTCVNGVPVTARQRLRDGDEILLADRVVMRVQLAGPASRRTSTVPVPTPSQSEPTPSLHLQARPSLRQYMEEKLERDRMIEEVFSVEGSFVDIDVVGSYQMKAHANQPAQIIVSFERFRSFVEGVIAEFGGQVLNSNGDELMCFFESTYAAVRSASAILARLDEFNARQNVLPTPFRFRIGIHTGRSLVDRERGVAYSAVLDTAGHLQKAASTNGLLISEATLRALPDGLPFEPAGALAHEGIATFRATGPIE
jgi:class 3 adenylate cyclase